jgi:subtilase family serine protease
MTLSWFRQKTNRIIRQAVTQIPRLERLETREVLSSVSLVPPSELASPLPNVSPNSSVAVPSSAGPTGFTPAQLRQAYGFNQITFDNGTIAGNGSGQTIAIVAAYDQPNLASDLAVFDSTLGIAAPPSFTKVNETGGSTLPAGNASWGGEETLDVEWAHGIAPGANILLVEASAPDPIDMMTAINYARNYPGVSVVSMSWAMGEFSSEGSYDGLFTTPANHDGVTFVAAVGDGGSSAAPNWPAVSPNVLAVGGTVLNTNSSGNYESETGWSGSAGGVSIYEPQPAYQQGVVTQTNAGRTVPDVSLAASGSNSVGSNYAVYDTYDSSGWTSGYPYGTSAAAPQWAALIAIADQGRALEGLSSLDGPGQTLPEIYQMSAGDFHDITSGSNGGYSARPGYDLVTGRGSPIANLVVGSLLTVPTGAILGDSSFEQVHLAAGSYQYDPTGSPWTFTGTSGISTNDSAFTSGNPNAPDGNQVAVLQETGSFSQTFTVATAGSYELYFYAAQRGNRNNGGEDFNVLIDGALVGTFKPTSTSYTLFSATISNLTAGSHSIEFVGVDSAGGDNTVFIDQVAFQSSLGGLLSDPSFERVQLAAGTYQYNPIGSPWTFSGQSPSGSGITTNGNAFTSGNPSAPNGNQVAFLQEYGTISQTFFVTTSGNSTLTFSAAQRGNRNNGGENFEVLIDNVVVGTFKPTSTSYSTFSVLISLPAAGEHTIEFLGLDSAGGDNTVFLDQIAIQPPVPILSDSSFEQVQLAPSTYRYNPTGSPWTFSGQSPSGSGITANSSAFTNNNPNAPVGSQVAFLQEKGSISQSFAVTSAGSYYLSFDAAQRGSGNNGGENFEVLLDGVVVATFNPTGASYATYTASITIPTSGTHTIEFLGLDSAGGDNTTFLDNVLLT